MRKVFLGLLGGVMLAGLAAVSPASAAGMHREMAGGTQGALAHVVQADWHRRHWAPPHRFHRHHGWGGGRFYR